MDIETMKYNNTQIPIAITIYLPEGGGISKLFILNNLFLAKQGGMNEAVENLWEDVFTYLINNYKGVIFVHNLGSASP